MKKLVCRIGIKTMDKFREILKNPLIFKIIFVVLLLFISGVVILILVGFFVYLSESGIGNFISNFLAILGVNFYNWLIGLSGFEIAILIISIILLLLLWFILKMLVLIWDTNRNTVNLLSTLDIYVTDIYGHIQNVEEGINNISNDVESIKDDFKDYKEKKFSKNDYEDYIS